MSAACHLCGTELPPGKSDRCIACKEKRRIVKTARDLSCSSLAFEEIESIPLESPKHDKRNTRKKQRRRRLPVARDDESSTGLVFEEIESIHLESPKRPKQDIAEKQRQRKMEKRRRKEERARKRAERKKRQKREQDASLSFSPIVDEPIAFSPYRTPPRRRVAKAARQLPRDPLVVCELIVDLTGLQSGSSQRQCGMCRAEIPLALPSSICEECFPFETGEKLSHSESDAGYEANDDEDALYEDDSSYAPSPPRERQERKK